MPKLDSKLANMPKTNAFLSFNPFRQKNQSAICDPYSCNEYDAIPALPELRLQALTLPLPEYTGDYWP